MGRRGGRGEGEEEEQEEEEKGHTSGELIPDGAMRCVKFSFH